MFSHRAKQTVYFEALLDSALLCAAFGLAFALRRALVLPVFDMGRTPDVASHFWLLSVGVPLFWVLANAVGLYSFGRYDSRALPVGAVLRSFAYLALFLGTAIFLLQSKGFSRAVFFSFLAIGFVLVLMGKVVLYAYLRRSLQEWASRRNVLIVGTGPDAYEVRRRIESHLDYGMRVVGHLGGPHEDESAAGPGGEPPLGRIEDLKRIVEEQVVDDVVFALPFERTLACDREIGWCEEVGVTVHVRTDFVRTFFARTYPSDLDGIPMLTVSPTPRDALSLLLKRLLDLSLSLVGLVVASPAFLGCALLIKMTSRGPVFFRQPRVGLHGRVFSLCKFRSMYRDAEERKKDLESRNEMSGPVFKIRRDPRVTSVGRFLRTFSLDELPQLWNVLVGDMSLVGPRPPIPEEVQKYERWQRRRLSMKPGITCLWQISGRNRVGFDEWMKLDLDYIDNWSLTLDLKILLRTVPAVLLARGAQ